MSARNGGFAPSLRLKRGLTVPLNLALCCLPSVSAAQRFDMPAGVTDVSQRIQQLHHLSFAICVVIGLIVFALMFYSLFAHRRECREKAAAFHENAWLEVAWTIVPTLILVGMAAPATLTLMQVDDTADADLTILITGSQWRWHYQYLDEDFGFFSNLATPREQIRNAAPRGEFYLREVDNPLVLPTDKKVRFLITSDDVIHAWWVHEFAVGAGTRVVRSPLGVCAVERARLSKLAVLHVVSRSGV